MDKDKLFKLIKSLNGAEKRYFSIWCTRHYGKEKNMTLLLFQDLVKQKVFNQKIFLKKFHHKPYTKNFRFAKHFLFKQILRCLHSFHAGRNIETQLSEMLDHADILSNKGMVAESIELLHNASALALKFECFGIYYEVKRKKLELFRDINYEGIGNNRIAEVVDEMKFALRKAEAIAEVESGVMQVMQSLSQSGISRGELQSQVLNLSKKLKPNAETADLFRSTLLFYQGMGALEFAKGSFEGASKWTANVLKLFSDFPHMREEKKKMFAVAVQNQLIISNYLDRYEGLEETLQSLDMIKADTPQLKNRVFYITKNMLLGTCVHVGDYERALKLVKEISVKHKKGEVEYLNRQQEIVFNFSSALAFFGAGRYKEANVLVNKVINDSNEQLRMDIASFARIFNIIIQFEAGKQELLEYSVRSTYRFLAKKKKLFLAEKVIMDFLRKTAPIINSKLKQKEAFTELYAALLPLSKKKNEKQFFQFFDFISWLESKLSGKEIGLVLQEKNPGYWIRN